MSKMKPDRKPPLAKSPIRLRPRRVLGSNSSCMQSPASRSEIRFNQTDRILTGGCFRTSEKGRRAGTWEMEEAEVRPEYCSISWEMRALAKMVEGDELGTEDCVAAAVSLNSNRLSGSDGGNSIPLFERGRFYEEYSARRNERLNRKRKNGAEAETNDSKKVSASASASASKAYKYNNKLGVTVESAKRNSFSSTSTASSARKLQSLRKSVSAAYETQRTQCETPAAAAPRYMLRSLMNKENVKPPLPRPRPQPPAMYKSATARGRKIGAPTTTPTPTPTPRAGY